MGTVPISVAGGHRNGTVPLCAPVDTEIRTASRNVPVPFHAKGDSPIFTDFSAKIGTVPVNAERTIALTTGRSATGVASYRRELPGTP
jgi:hypothetical protein